jgi:hypothetical protein
MPSNSYDFVKADDILLNAIEERKRRHSAAAFDAAPAPGLSQHELLQLLIDLQPKFKARPVQTKRRATAAAFDAEAGQFCSNVELNERYRKLKEQRGAYHYDGR